MFWLLRKVRGFLFSLPIWLTLFRLSKYIQHHIFRRGSELERLCKQRISYRQIYGIDRSLLYSKQLTIPRRQLESHDAEDLYQIYNSICVIKNFRSEVLYNALIQIFYTNKLLHDVSARAGTKYDHTNKVHEKKLTDLWNSLMDVSLKERISKQWQELGFQGVDPATDFRGMGVLGLEQLLFFAKRHQERAKSVLSTARDKKIWYQFALVGITITAFIVQLLRSRRLQIFLFLAMDKLEFSHEWQAFRSNELGQVMRTQQRDDELQYLRETFNELYCYLFYQFNEKWKNSFPDATDAAILQFPRIFGEFKDDIQDKIIDLDGVFYYKMRDWCAN